MVRTFELKGTYHLLKRSVTIDQKVRTIKTIGKYKIQISKLFDITNYVINLWYIPHQL